VVGAFRPPPPVAHRRRWNAGLPCWLERVVVAPTAGWHLRPVGHHHGVIRYHRAWQSGQAEIATAGGAGRRSAKNARLLHGSIARSAPLGAAAPLPRGGQSAAVLRPSGPTRGHDLDRYRHTGRVGNAGGRRRHSRTTSVGVNGLGHGGSRAGTGRTAEHASEAARAADAVPTPPPTVPGDRRAPGHRVPSAPLAFRRSGRPACRGRQLTPLGVKHWPRSSSRSPGRSAAAAPSRRCRSLSGR
jgi:hypothetical protein